MNMIHGDRWATSRTSQAEISFCVFPGQMESLDSP